MSPPVAPSGRCRCRVFFRDRATHPANICSHMLPTPLSKFGLSNSRMKAIKAQFCSCGSQNIRHGLAGMRAVMCGKAALLGSCAQEFRGKWKSAPSLALLRLLYFHVLRSGGLGTNQIISEMQCLPRATYRVSASSVTGLVPAVPLHFNVTFNVRVCSSRVATSTDDLNLYHPQTDSAGATSLSLSLLVYLI